ncbi:heavy-metal-associated domain-containing protein [Roseisalinus antarcticus]|jgi:copper chaperone|uniref:Heavy-metal-associated domain protein n=1 Tax=Roseisalinus antarcticus TaxID=254357 RepID=A0A1Y5TXT0_9RHOB|nr:heavy-metal-associated domain-containing protein [Roseisalinus antarcticus]SLN76432.1 Heavy-metal-associated domain protein [Roseisalinus antarcticus]
MKFHVPDMSCGHCTAAIDKALKAIDPDARVDSDLTLKTVAVVSAQDAGAFQTALREAGYPGTPA